jgi:hypothetical protein
LRNGGIRYPKGGSVPFWQFYGGDVYLDLTITVSILDGDRPQPNDDLSRRLFAIIMEHELLHVLDEIDIVSKWMPMNLYRDNMVLKYLSNTEPVDNAMFQSWFKGNGFSDWLKGGFWAPDQNARAWSRKVDTGFRKQSRSSKKMERDYDSKKSHPALILHKCDDGRRARAPTEDAR